MEHPPVPVIRMKHMPALLRAGSSTDLLVQNDLSFWEKVLRRPPSFYQTPTSNGVAVMWWVVDTMDFWKTIHDTVFLVIYPYVSEFKLRLFLLRTKSICQKSLKKFFLFQRKGKASLFKIVEGKST